MRQKIWTLNIRTFSTMYVMVMCLYVGFGGLVLVNKFKRKKKKLKKLNLPPNPTCHFNSWICSLGNKYYIHVGVMWSRVSWAVGVSWVDCCISLVVADMMKITIFLVIGIFGNNLTLWTTLDEEIESLNKSSHY